MIARLSVAGYRSVRDLTLPLGPLTVLTGPNGCGKSNLYQALYLLHAAADGSLARTLAHEGGMASALWAGPRRAGPVRLQLSVALRDADGRRVSLPLSLNRSESVLTQIADPERYPYLVALRETLRRWRFYHAFRTDPDASPRQPQIGTFTPALAHDGRDLAAALATILEIGEAERLHTAIAEGLDSARLSIDNQSGRFSVMLQTSGRRRPLAAAELSDGTLRYLCLVAALLSPRLPPLLALNEPETSLHPDLIPALARLIVDVSARAQLWIATHSRPLTVEIGRLSGVAPIVLQRHEGATGIASGL